MHFSNSRCDTGGFSQVLTQEQKWNRVIPMQAKWSEGGERRVGVPLPKSKRDAEYAEATAIHFIPLKHRKSRVVEWRRPGLGIKRTGF